MKTLCRCLIMGVMVVAAANLAFAQAKKGGGSAAAPASSAAQTAAPTASSSAAIESQMLAYGGLDKIASDIATTVCSKMDGTSSTVVIYDQASFANIQSYGAFVANAKAMVLLYETLLSENHRSAFNENLKNEAEKKKVKPRSFGISNAIDPFQDASGLLQAIAVASNSESPGSIVIPDSAMAVAITRELKQSTPCAPKRLNVIYPPLFGNSSSTDVSTTDIDSILQKLQDVRVQAITDVDAANMAWMDKYRGTTGNPVLANVLQDVNGVYDSLMNSLLQVNPSTGTIGSASVIQGHQLANVLAGPSGDDGTFKYPAFILLASILSAGGTEHVHKTLWTALSTGDKITYSGGVVVNVSLWRSNTKAPIYSNVLRYRAPFSDVKNPNSTDNVTDGDNLLPPKP